MIKKIIIISGLLLGLFLTNINKSSANDSEEQTTYQTNGDVSFYGSYDQSNEAEKTAPVYQPTDQNSPYYGGANQIEAKPVLPNTGGLPIQQVMVAPSLLLLIAAILMAIRANVGQVVQKQR
jgi:hypothetical protein